MKKDRSAIVEREEPAHNQRIVFRDHTLGFVRGDHRGAGPLGEGSELRVRPVAEDADPGEKKGPLRLREPAQESLEVRLS